MSYDNHKSPCREGKKLRVGEFQELVFEVRIRFHQTMEEARLDTFLDDFIELIESRRLVVGGRHTAAAGNGWHRLYAQAGIAH
jgi:uncharacterized protein YggL (DUF469 family)